MTLRVSCDDLQNWRSVNADMELDTEDKVEGSASILAFVVDGTKYEAIIQYSLGPDQAIDLTYEPILRLRIKPSLVTSNVYVQLLITSGDAFNQVNIGAVAPNQGEYNLVDVDLSAIEDPAFDITKWRGFTIRYYLSAVGQTPTVNIDAVESLPGLPDLHVTGIVTDEATQAPLDNVSVEANGDSTVTASDGSYELALPPGRYEITYSRTGYRDKTLSADVTADIVLNVALEPLPPQTILTISTAPSGAGVTDPQEGIYSADVGSIVDVSAVAQPGYVFGYWELDGANVGSAMPYSVTMDVDHELRAVFDVVPTHTLTINSTPIVNIPFKLERL